MNLKNIQAIVIIFLTVILAACNSSFLSGPVSKAATPSYTQFAEVRFIDRLLDSHCTWDAKKSGTASFTSPSIFAVDRNTSFLFGALYTQGGIRSLLLRSNDGGNSWEEVMPPILNYIVFSVSFTNSKLGWAAIVYGMESPGNIILYKSEDGGQSWSEFTHVDVSTLGYGVGSPVAMLFQDEQDGKIIIGFEEHFSILETEDGGVTWHETEQLPFPITVSLNTSENRALDWSSWKIDTSEETNNQYISISRLVAGEGDWQTTAILPEHFKIRNGCVVSQ